MRYARIILWILFVVFFLIYLTAIKLVRGNQPQIQFQNQQRVHQRPAIANPYVQFSQHQIPATSSVKETRDLAEFLTFGQDPLHASSIVQHNSQQQALPTSYNVVRQSPAVEQQPQIIARRNLGALPVRQQQAHQQAFQHGPIKQQQQINNGE